MIVWDVKNRVKRNGASLGAHGVGIGIKMGPIKLDIDNRKRLPSRRKMVAKLRWAGYTMSDFTARRSPSGTGWHVMMRIEPEPTTAVEVVALQALLGSDPFREASNLNRARHVDAGTVTGYWRKRWNTLYTKRPEPTRPKLSATSTRGKHDS